MAWTDQCRYEAVRSVDHKIDQGMPVRDALNAVAKESDIPAGTLRRWKYPEKCVPKNGNKRKLSQMNVWNNVRMKMELLIAYMESNCETPAEIPENMKRAICRHIDTFNLFKQEM